MLIAIKITQGRLSLAALFLQKTVMGEGLEQRFLYHFKSDKLLNSALLSPEGLFPRSTMTLAASFSSSTLRPHRPYDCAINLLPRAPLPSRWLDSLSRADWEAMESYLSESLVSGFIRPLSSPISVGFFFVKKKDGSLHLCIDHRALNAITTRNRYPLPLLESAFAPLHQARVFIKLDLRNAYHLVSIRQGE